MMVCVTNPRLGELLQAAGLIGKQDLEAAICCSKVFGNRIGETLVKQRLISTHQLNCAIDAQTNLRTGKSDYSSTMFALQRSCREGGTFASALRNSQWQNLGDARKHEPPALLLASGLITNAQLDQALDVSLRNGCSLGRALVSLGFITQEILELTIEMACLIRDKRFTRRRVIDMLSLVSMGRDKVEDSNFSVMACVATLSNDDAMLQAS